MPCGDPQLVRPTALTAEGPRHGKAALLRGQDQCETVLRTAGWWDAAQELLATVARGSARTPTNGSISAPPRLRDIDALKAVLRSQDLIEVEILDGGLERRGTLMAEVISRGLGVALGVSCVFSASASNSQAPCI